jgi:hypothetical protein
MNRFLKAVLFATLLTGARPAAAGEPIITAPRDFVVGANGQRHGLGLLVTEGERHGVTYWEPRAKQLGAAMLDEYDLRTMGWVAPIRDQGSCGSCWAFSITKALESARLRAGLTTLDMAEQDMVSCDKNAYACNGGQMDDMDYVVKKGLPLESNYKYTATSSRCKNPEPAVAAKGVRWGYCGKPGKQPTVAEIKQCLVDFGVLSVVVAAGGRDWTNGGDMNGCTVSGQNHMVNLAGWVKKSGKEKLVVANSWGPDWGDKGFAYAAQGCDELAGGPESVSFVVVDGAGPGPSVPHVSLPARVDVHPGTEIALGRRVAETGVAYSWFQDDAQMPETESQVYVTPTKDTVYRVKATTPAGTAEASVEVHVLASEIENF